MTLGRFAVPLTVFAVIGVVNAINLCDGAVALILLLAFVLAGMGVAGRTLRVPEHVMFYTAMAVFVAYILLVQYGLRRVTANAPGLGLSGRR